MQYILVFKSTCHFEQCVSNKRHCTWKIFYNLYMCVCVYIYIYIYIHTYIHTHTHTHTWLYIICWLQRK